MSRRCAQLRLPPCPAVAYVENATPRASPDDATRKRGAARHRRQRPTDPCFFFIYFQYPSSPSTSSFARPPTTSSSPSSAPRSRQTSSMRRQRDALMRREGVVKEHRAKYADGRVRSARRQRVNAACRVVKVVGRCRQRLCRAAGRVPAPR